MKFALIVLAVLVGLGRLTVPGHDLSWPGTYEALAHIYVGVLIVFSSHPEVRRTATVCLVALTAFEALAFLMRAN